MDAKVYELLVKTANRLDELELFDEAEAIDKYLMSLAGEKEEDNDPLSKMVGLANALDCSGDEQLQKYASVLDEIMLTIGAPRGANHEFESKAEAELDKLREKYRAEGREEVYKERRKELDEQNGKEATTKALADQVKKYKPLEMPLSTRYCPDHPGGLLIRVGDHVYQCEMDKKMYNYQTGFTTNKGNVIPGGGVEHQIKDWGNRDLGHAMFDTRQTVMSRFASDETKDDSNMYYDDSRDAWCNKETNECGPNGPAGDISEANDLPPFTYGLHMLDGRKVLLVKSEMKLDEKQRAAIANKIKSSFGQAYEIVFEQDIS